MKKKPIYLNKECNIVIDILNIVRTSQRFTLFNTAITQSHCEIFIHSNSLPEEVTADFMERIKPIAFIHVN